MKNTLNKSGFTHHHRLTFFNVELLRLFFFCKQIAPSFTTFMMISTVESTFQQLQIPVNIDIKSL